MCMYFESFSNLKKRHEAMFYSGLINIRIIHSVLFIEYVQTKRKEKYIDRVATAYLYGNHLKEILISTHNIDFCLNLHIISEPPHGKTNNLPRRKQRRRSASQ